MDEDNISRALMIGVTTFITIMTISAILLFYNSSLSVVSTAGTGIKFGNINRADIESSLLMSNTGNYIKGTNVKNILSYYEENGDVSVIIHNIKYIDTNGNVQSYPELKMESYELNIRRTAYDIASNYIIDNQEFTISVDEDSSNDELMIITIEGV